MNIKLVSCAVLALLIGSSVPALASPQQGGNVGTHTPQKTAVNVTLDVAITTDWVNGWQDHGLRIREFPLDGNVYAYSEISASDLYGLYFTQKWYYDNGTGMEFKWSWGWQITEHWTSSASWSYWQIGLDYGKGEGVIETLIDNVSIGFSNYYGMDNHKPDTPTITGPDQAKYKKPVLYNFTGTDIDGFDVSYLVDWGDNTTTDWTDYQHSGAMLQLNHTWAKKGDYTIRCKIRDREFNESAWATLPVTLPYEPDHPFVHWLLARFPHAFPLLRNLYGD